MLKGFGETAPERDIKFAHVDLKSVEADDTFSGYASLFNQMHSGHDLVSPDGRGPHRSATTRCRA
jgi:hypothetical protein